jgi:hypothetical protein
VNKYVKEQVYGAKIRIFFLNQEKKLFQRKKMTALVRERSFFICLPASNRHRLRDIWKIKVFGTALLE